MLPFDKCKILTRKHVTFDEMRFLSQLDFKSIAEGEQIYKFQNDYMTTAPLPENYRLFEADEIKSQATSERPSGCISTFVQQS